jgi:valyl-tRNA synthetase
MSKSLGNVIDPLEIIKDYGTDALRFTVATGLGREGERRTDESSISLGGGHGQRRGSNERVSCGEMDRGANEQGVRDHGM